jgi:uncharacterized protein
VSDLKEQIIKKTPYIETALDRLVQRLVNGLAPEKIILFGSYAQGHPTADSDLDIMIVVPESDEPAYRRSQKAYKWVGAIGMSKDLLVLTKAEFEAQSLVTTSLARRVQKEGIVLYERGKTDRSSEMADRL